MKKLILIRHGSAAELAENDFVRPLTFSGKNQVQKIGAKLTARELFPQIVLSSPALRAKETVSEICHSLSFNLAEIQFNSDFYSGGIDAYLDKIFEIDAAMHTALIVGHNPVISELVHYFCNDDFIHLSPGSVVLISFDSNEWNLLQNPKMEIL